ncbi:MAG: addiction module protein [Candidatus Kapaibacterium sp.]
MATQLAKQDHWKHLYPPIHPNEAFIHPAWRGRTIGATPVRIPGEGMIPGRKLTGKEMRDFDTEPLMMETSGKVALRSPFESSNYMFRDTERLIQESLQLPPGERLRIADRLYESVPINNKKFNREAVMEEAKRRIEEYRRGEGTNLTREESMGRARRMIEEAKRSRG